MLVIGCRVLLTARHMWQFAFVVPFLSVFACRILHADLLAKNLPPPRYTIAAGIEAALYAECHTDGFTHELGVTHRHLR